MPRNTHNFWIETRVDGRKTKSGVGPQRRDGGFDLTVKQRDAGEIIEAIEILGRADDNGNLTLRIHCNGIASIGGAPIVGDILIKTHREYKLPSPKTAEATAPRFPYSIELTAAEYRDALYMCARGYLGDITSHASEIDDRGAEGVTLNFSEPDAWKVRETCDEDVHAVWALTTPSTDLGAKFQRFLDSIV